MKPRILLFAAALVLILACGGGGGGVSTGSLTYTTDWTNKSASGGGASQRVRLYSSTGTLVNSWIMNAGSLTSDSVNAPSLAGGTYLVSAQLFSGSNASGIQTGLFEKELAVSGPISVSTFVGTAVDSIKVSPDQAVLGLPGSKTFHAAAQNSSAKDTFVAPGSITWTTLGGIGTVNSDGTLLSTASGTGFVRATHGPTGKLGSAAVQVDNTIPTTSQWTIFVYLNAANDLFSFSDLNVNQIEQAVSNPNVRVVIQWKQSQSMFSNSSFNGTRRYLAQQDTSAQIGSTLIQNLGTGVDMGDPQTLSDFIQWGKTYYPAQRYGLIVWNHGNGWRRSPDSRAVSYDDETGSSIQIWDFPTAFGTEQFDFVAFDASLMQMIEVAYELRNNTKYVVGSEESPPGEGYPYTPIMAAFRDNSTASTSTLTKSFVDAMVNEPSYASRKITQSVLDTSKLANVATKLDLLGFALLTNSASMTTVIPSVRTSSQAYSQATSPPRYYRDIVDACQRLEALSSVSAVNSASAAVRAAVGQAVVWEGHNANSPGSHGLSIDFSPGNVFLSSSTDYANMQFGQATRWDDWLATAP